MSRIKEIDGTSQDVLYAFDFKTRKRPVFINFNNKLIHADLSGKDFDPLLCFPFYENLSNPDRTIEDLILACQWTGPEKITMEILPGLIESMPKVDPETINFIVKGKEKKQGEPIYWGEIGFILVYASLKENWETVIKANKLYLRERQDRDPKTFPDGYNPHGATKKKGLTTTDPGFYKEWTGSRSGYPDEKETQHQEPKPKPKEPGPKTKAKLIPFPKYPTTPKDWMKYAEKVVGGSNVKPIGKQIYRRSKRMYLNNVPHYPKETTRRGCYYFCGVEYMARVAGVSVPTVIRVLNLLAEAKLIYIRYHGYKGRGCSIIEVPPNMKLVMKWRREHKR